MNTPIAEQRFADFLAALAARSPTPGGGAAAGAVGAVAASLAEMVVAYSLGKKDLANHAPTLEAARAALARARSLFTTLADEDAQAYALFSELSRLPAADPRRAAELPAAVDACTAAPLAMLAAAADLSALCRDLAPITNRHLRSDLAIAAVLADAAARASRWNVLVNIPSLDEPARMDASRLMNRMLGESARLADAVQNACQA